MSEIESNNVVDSWQPERQPVVPRNFIDPIFPSIFFPATIVLLNIIFIKDSLLTKIFLNTFIFFYLNFFLTQNVF